MSKKLEGKYMSLWVEGMGTVCSFEKDKHSAIHTITKELFHPTTYYFCEVDTEPFINEKFKDVEWVELVRRASCLPE
jgi:hypothetical protein